MTILKKIFLPDRYNYIGCFLTLQCNFNCEYCINWFGGKSLYKRPTISGKDWVMALNRIHPRLDLPVTFQGGEPNLHPDFIWIIKNINPGFNLDILTNLSFDVDEFIKGIDPSCFRRIAPYPSIRVSYHPFYMSLDILIKKVLKMQEANFSIGVYGILHPKFREDMLNAQKKCLKLGIDFRTKEFLGEFKGKLYGTYRYHEAITKHKKMKCLCRSSELIIGPDASIYRCHHDLYKNLPPLGNLLDPKFTVEDIFRRCSSFGQCNPCDIKIKTNRFHVDGYTSVEIREIKKLD